MHNLTYILVKLYPLSELILPKKRTRVNSGALGAPLTRPAPPLPRLRRAEQAGKNFPPQTPPIFARSPDLADGVQKVDKQLKKI